MTVIALFETLGVAISDLLMTRDGTNAWQYLPSVGTPGEYVQGLPFHSTRLVRKVDKLGIGGQATPLMVAGTVSHVEAFLDIARKLVQGSISPLHTDFPLNRDDIESVLRHATSHAEATKMTQFSVMGLRNAHTVIVGQKPIIRRDLAYFGTVTIAGSGAEALLRYLEERSEEYAKAFGSDTEVLKGMRVGHYLTMQLLHADRQTPSTTLSAGVGGFYEFLINFNGKLEGDGMGWVRIMADLDEPYAQGVRLRGLWWHTYDDDDLLIASAPSEDILIAAGSSQLIPIEHFTVQRFGSFTKSDVEEPPHVIKALRRIPRAKFFSSCLSIKGETQTRVAISMEVRGGSAFQVSWFENGLRVFLDKEKHARVLAEVRQNQATLL